MDNIRDLLERSEKMLTALQFAGHEYEGCESCGYYHSDLCPICSSWKDTREENGGHYDGCELGALIQELRMALGIGNREEEEREQRQRADSTSSQPPTIVDVKTGR